MKNAKLILTLTAIALSCLLVLSGVLSPNVTAATAQLPEFNLADSADPARGSAYPESSARVISAAQAPAGADGNVIELFGTEGAGVLMDYSAYDISCYGIRSITVKVYIPGDVKALNLTVDNGENTWAGILRPDTRRTSGPSSLSTTKGSISSAATICPIWRTKKADWGSSR